MNVRMLTALAVATAALAAGPAHANDPAAYVDPFQEGSVTDLTNIQKASMSDLTGISAQANPNGCVAVAERPKAQTGASSTGMIVTTQITLTCQGLSSGSDTFRIKRMRWYGEETLASYTLSVSPSGIATQSLTTACRAGTWNYLVTVTGTHSFHTSSSRFTCVKSTDLFFIET